MDSDIRTRELRARIEAVDARVAALETRVQQYGAGMAMATVFAVLAFMRVFAG